MVPVTEDSACFGYQKGRSLGRENGDERRAVFRGVDHRTGVFGTRPSFAGSQGQVILRILVPFLW